MRHDKVANYQIWRIFVERGEPVFAVVSHHYLVAVVDEDSCEHVPKGLVIIDN
jgi:hypothetical protein